MPLGKRQHFFIEIGFINDTPELIQWYKYYEKLFSVIGEIMKIQGIDTIK